jgi:hypothetical protein
VKKDEVRTQAVEVGLDIDLPAFGEELVKAVEHSVFAICQRRAEFGE